MFRAARLLPLVLLWLLHGEVFAGPLLDVSLKGLEGELKENALAWLGAPPETAQERLIYIVSIERNLERSLQALGYYAPDIEVDILRTEPVWQARVTVNPGDPVRIRHVSVQFQGGVREDEAFDKLLSDVPFTQGDVLHHGQFETFRRRVLALGLRRGYFDGVLTLSRVEVEPVAGTADIFLHYESGERYHFGKLDYDHEQIMGTLLEPLRTFSAGDYYDQAKLQQFQSSLQRTGYFSSVLVRPETEMAENTIVPISLELYPAERHRFSVGVGFSTDTEERVSVTWRTPRVNRYGHRQETRLQYSRVNPSGRFTYTIPLKHPLDDVLQLSARLEDNEFGDLDSLQQELGVRRETSRGGWLRGLSLRGLNESWRALGEDRESSYLLPGVSLSRKDRRGSAVNPSGGFGQVYQLEAGGENLGSDIDLVRATANFRVITTPWTLHRFVGKLDLGAVFLADGDEDELAPSLAYFAGGSQSIRGYGYQSIGNEITVTDEKRNERNLVVGGTRLLVASLEYQYAFSDTWRGALFVDGGDAFDEGNFDMNVGAGFGIHYVTAVGAIRLDIANPVTDDDPKWRFHLAVGAEF
jgi:translocation and assembly module TamA